jgi:hypothetical protein
MLSIAARAAVTHDCRDRWITWLRCSGSCVMPGGGHQVSRKRVYRKGCPPWCQEAIHGRPRRWQDLASELNRSRRCTGRGFPKRGALFAKLICRGEMHSLQAPLGSSSQWAALAILVCIISPVCANHQQHYLPCVVAWS